MQLTGNTILITGGGSGIGRGLAEAFHALGNTVIITGRREAVLAETVTAKPGMHSIVFDVEDPASIAKLAAELKSKHPGLNTVLHNAGIMQTEKLLQASDIAIAEQTIAINLLGPIRLNAALLPQLEAQAREQGRATILTVTSGLASVPLAYNPSYCATKAALHSWTQSLRYQLRETAIKVIELVPPYVQTGLTGEHQAKDPMAMPLAEYLEETMRLLATRPDAEEILVERVLPLRTAESTGQYAGFYKKFNDTMVAARHLE